MDSCEFAKAPAAAPMLRWHGWAQLLGQVGSRLTSSAPNEGKMDIQFVHPFWGCYVLLSLQILYFFHMVSGEKLDTVSGGITIKHDVSNYQKGCFLEGTCQLQAVGDLLLQTFIWCDPTQQPQSATWRRASLSLTHADPHADPHARCSANRDIHKVVPPQL